MRARGLCVVVAAVVGIVLGELPPPEASYRILMLLPVSTWSHRNVFMLVAEALADRGHKVTMLINQPKSSNNSNILEIRHDQPYYEEESRNVFKYLKISPGAYSMLQKTLPELAKTLYRNPKVMELYHRRKDYDLIIVNQLYNEVVYPFVHEMLYMTIATSGLDPRQSATLGNVLNPSYVPNYFQSSPSPFSLWDKIQNLFGHIWIPFSFRQFIVASLLQREITAQFPDLPPLLDIDKNQSLVLINSHFSISTTVPLLPSQVEIGAIHCRPANPLPQHLESWISGAGPEGVIYFSLGSFVSSNYMPAACREAFVEAFRCLPHRVIWKYDGELEGVSDNVMLSKWLPQQDILGHDNVKVFITHGGLLSLQESIHHGKPLLVLPLFSDQPKNGRFVKDNGLGDILSWESLTVEAIVSTLTEITSNQKYKDAVQTMSRPLRDQLTTPRERAVFWTEYVIRHRGAPHLRSPAAQLSWVEFLMLDVLAALCGVVLVLVYVVRHVLRAVCSSFLGDGGTKKKLE